MKCDNLMLVGTKTDDLRVKIIDFGLSKKILQGDSLKTDCGTVDFKAPEVYGGKYDARCDLWSVGVIAYWILSGSPPFLGKDQAETAEAVRSCDYSFRGKVWRSIS